MQLPPIFRLSKAKALYKKQVLLQTSETHEETRVKEKIWSSITLSLSTLCLALLLLFMNGQSVSDFITPIVTSLMPLSPLQHAKSEKEIFGFAPWWTFHKLDNVDFNTLTTMAYFGLPLDETGTIDTEDPGYKTFKSERATEIFKKAHAHGTRVVATMTIMKNPVIEAFLDSDSAQHHAIEQTVTEVRNRGIDGINVDIEYAGTPAAHYRGKFTAFVTNLTAAMKKAVPESRVTVSVYALSAKEKKLYDVAEIARVTDGLFVMAYDFAVANSEVAMPTAPLYGKKQGKYAYDIASSIEAFLTLVPAHKIILGVPYYGYNYPVKKPQVNASVYRRGKAQTYELAMDSITAEKEGWDEVGQVGWKAYYSEESGSWRMIFLEDVKSLGLKYDFAQSHDLGGVGIWALGFDNGKEELWDLLRAKFGQKLADTRVVNREIREDI